MSHVQSHIQHRPPPPNSRFVIDLWATLPQVNRELLLGLLSQLLERRLEPALLADKEDSDERDDYAE